MSQAYGSFFYPYRVVPTHPQDNKKVVLNTKPDIIPELEFYLPEYK